MLKINFQEHNSKVRKVWEAYNNEKPFKVPVIIYAGVRNWILEEEQNLKHITWKDYIENKDLMFETQILTEEWIRLNILSDEPKGYPDEGWTVFVDFQNFYEQVWFGSSIKYGAEPDAVPFLNDGNKNMIFNNGIPDAFEGIGKKLKEYYEYFIDKSKSYYYKDISVSNINMPGNVLGTDGPFTIACCIRGVTNFIEDIMYDTYYADKLLDFITTAIIERIKKVRKYLSMDEKSESFGFADDSIAMISPEMYKDLVLPYHKRLLDELTLPDSKRSVHLCGNAQKHFPILERELNIKSFDTGFPIDFGRLYDELSTDVQILGGPNINMLKFGTVDQIEKEVQRILGSGVKYKSKKFVLREGNAVAPNTSFENINTIYEACEKYGYYL